MTKGYWLQFMSTPSVTKIAVFSTMADSQHKEALVSKILTLPAKAAIGQVRPQNQQAIFYSRYFLVLKRDGICGPVSDLRGLNKFLRPLKCKMLTVPRVKQAVAVRDLFATVDSRVSVFRYQSGKGIGNFLGLLRVLRAPLWHFSSPLPLHQMHGYVLR